MTGGGTTPCNWRRLFSRYIFAETVFTKKFIAMAISGTNTITRGYHGKIGNQFIIKKHGRKTVLAARPERGNVVLTPAQQEQCRKFAEAVRYAKDAMNDPKLRRRYQAKANPDRPAYNVAISDFMTWPWIDWIDTDAYHGHKGDHIFILAADPGKVSSASLVIRDAEGVEIESGECFYEETSSRWVYIAGKDHGPIAGLRIYAVIRDLPGHLAEKEICLPESPRWRQNDFSETMP